MASSLASFSVNNWIEISNSEMHVKSFQTFSRSGQRRTNFLKSGNYKTNGVFLFGAS